MTEMLLLCFLWAMYFVLHSVLASLEVKDYVKRRFGGLFSYYRLFYNAFAIAGFIAIAWYSEHHFFGLIAVLPPWVNWVGYSLLLGGVVVIAVALMGYDLHEFTGLKSMSEYDAKTAELNVTGLNAWVRHPLYFGTILLFSGYLLLAFSWNAFILVSVSFVYLAVGSWLEEKKLVKLYGRKYTDYQGRVPKLFPFI